MTEAGHSCYNQLMIIEFKEILRGYKKALSLISHRDRLMLIFAAIVMIIAGFLTNLPAVILGKLADRVVDNNQITFGLVFPFIVLIIVIILIREAINVIRKYIVENTATRTEKLQTTRTIEHLLKTDLSIINNRQVGSWHGKVFRSIQGLIRLIKLSFLDFLPTFFTAVAAICIALYQKPLFAFIMILVIPAGFYLILRQISSQKGIRISLLREKEKIDGKVVESLGGLETVRALNTVDYETNKVEQIAEKIRSKEIKHHLSMALFDSAKYLNEGFFYVLVVCVAIFFASKGMISRGDILVYTILFSSITGPLREIHRILDEAHESSIRVSDLFEILGEPVDKSYSAVLAIASPPQNITFPAIRINNLSFSYPGKEGLLKNVDMLVEKGEKIGIAGASGCGKSTLIKILLRLIHDYKGDISIDGNDLLALNRLQLAKLIAYVPQKPYVFSGNIRENILYGNSRSKISEQEIIEAAKNANIWEEIEKTLGGLEGKISENGNNISGGQRQRIALARLMLNSPELIILDEATSALDNQNEAIIQKNIENVFSNKTIIVIAHRLTTLKNCDKIYVFEQGQIVQSGNFDHLAEKNGIFKDFLEQRTSAENG